MKINAFFYCICKLNLYLYNVNKQKQNTMTTENTLIKFEEGNIYQMNFIGDSDLKPQFICVKTTGKTATFERFKNPSDKITRRIKTFRGVEYIVDGSYSMAPSIYADKIVG